MSGRDYIREGAEIYRRSFAIIRSEADLSRFSGTAERVVVRMIHACGMTDLPKDVDLSADFADAAEAALNQPYDVRLDPAGNLYIADFGNHRIRMVDSVGLMRTIAGTGEPGYSGDGGPATEARLHGPYGVFPDTALGLLIADSYNHVIRVVDRSGRIRTLAGTGRRGFSGDGGGAGNATFDTPQGLSVTDQGWILVGDEHNHALRAIEPDGSVRLLAGSGRAGFSPDGTPAKDARLADPENMLPSSDGTLFFTEAGSGRVRYVGPDGRLGTLAGGGP